MKPTFRCGWAARSAPRSPTMARPRANSCRPVARPGSGIAISVLLPNPTADQRNELAALDAEVEPRSACTALPLLPKTLVRPRVSMSSSAGSWLDGALPPAAADRRGGLRGGALFGVHVSCPRRLSRPSCGRVLERDLVAAFKPATTSRAQRRDTRLHRHRSKSPSVLDSTRTCAPSRLSWPWRSARAEIGLRR